MAAHSAANPVGWRRRSRIAAPAEENSRSLRLGVLADKPKPQRTGSREIPEV